jgi:hypothetical protein
VRRHDGEQRRGGRRVGEQQDGATDATGGGEWRFLWDREERTVADLSVGETVVASLVVRAPWRGRRGDGWCVGGL